MENSAQQDQEIFSHTHQVALPNATGVLVLGILSIATCCCWGIVGLICGIISLVLAKKDTIIYNLNPMRYTPGSYSNLRGGKVCAIIGIVLSSLFLIYAIFVIVAMGFAALHDPQVMREWMEAHRR